MSPFNNNNNTVTDEKESSDLESPLLELDVEEDTTTTNVDDDNNNNDRQLVLCSSLRLCCCFTNTNNSRAVVLIKPILFLRKTIWVIVASYALVPLLLYKNNLPATLYASLLILIHVFVLIVYLYGVKFFQLDVDRVSLGGRVIGLLAVIYLLTIVSGWESDSNLPHLLLQMMVLCFVHTVVLAFLMVAIVRVKDDNNIESDEDDDILRTSSLGNDDIVNTSTHAGVAVVCRI